MVLLVQIQSCDYSDRRLQIKNDSKEVIVAEFSEDTLLKEMSNDNIECLTRDKILPGETLRKTMIGSENGWPFLIQRSKNKRLNVFFIIVDTITKYQDWNHIREGKSYYRKEYTLEELEKTKWIIEYHSADVRQ